MVWELELGTDHKNYTYIERYWERELQELYFLSSQKNSFYRNFKQKGSKLWKREDIIEVYKGIGSGPKTAQYCNLIDNARSDDRYQCSALGVVRYFEEFGFDCNLDAGARDLGSENYGSGNAHRNSAHPNPNTADDYTHYDQK
jgi:hypothetical protein